VGLTAKSKKSDVGAKWGVNGLFGWNIEWECTANGMGNREEMEEEEEKDRKGEN
jgi:hypothetical protein